MYSSTMEFMDLLQEPSWSAMGLKKRSKAQAEFSMSSLTDIIFLLLVFFMLTATFVNVKKLELPE